MSECKRERGLLLRPLLLLPLPLVTLLPLTLPPSSTITSALAAASLTTAEASSKHRFWSTQPVSKYTGGGGGEAVATNSPIPSGARSYAGPLRHQTVESTKQEPYALPAGFEWSCLDLSSTETGNLEEVREREARARASIAKHISEEAHERSLFAKMYTREACARIAQHMLAMREEVLSLTLLTLRVTHARFTTCWLGITWRTTTPCSGLITRGSS